VTVVEDLEGQRVLPRHQRHEILVGEALDLGTSQLDLLGDLLEGLPRKWLRAFRKVGSCRVRR
jgi:hypothetical protein